ncbi:MAG: methionine--tRNA ligase [Verrucomicrobia bacterium]|nr:methionine--tRNA ligase [Verrucomicrobiota bacterium]
MPPTALKENKRPKKRRVPKVLITSALPYANGALHFGHIAGAYLPADCYARFCRLRGDDVLFICGSDEYGIPITINAEMAGRTPQQHVDIFHKVNKDLFAQLRMSFDNYSRTSWKGHIPTVQEFFTDLLNNGYIEPRTTKQLYSEKDGRFLADRYVTGTCPKCGFDAARGDECPKCAASYEATDLINPRSKISGGPLVAKPTKHWFLRFDLFAEKLREWIATKNWKPSVTHFAMSYVDDLKARAITRDGEWGVPIPLPDTEGKVLYVWFDAPIGYISATKEGFPDTWQNYWLKDDVQYVQFLGKDNIPFHAVFFPAMVMGQNKPYKQVDDIAANEFLNLEGRQFSKSDGWTIDLDRFFEHFTADQIRYVLAANAPETQDSEFTWKDFQTRCNSELLGKYGNLANRVLVFIANKAEGRVPEQEFDTDFINKVKELAKLAAEAYSTYHLRKASQLVMEIAAAGNVYFDGEKPWKIEDPAKKGKVLRSCLECLKILALVSSPIVPDAAQKLWQMLGQKEALSKENWDAVLKTPLKAGLALPKPEVLFKRVEDAIIQEEIDKLAILTAQKQG